MECGWNVSNRRSGGVRSPSNAAEEVVFTANALCVWWTVLSSFFQPGSFLFLGEIPAWPFFGKPFFGTRQYCIGWKNIIIIMYFQKRPLWNKQQQKMFPEQHACTSEELFQVHDSLLEYCVSITNASNHHRKKNAVEYIFLYHGNTAIERIKWKVNHKVKTLQNEKRLKEIMATLTLRAYLTGGFHVHHWEFIRNTPAEVGLRLLLIAHSHFLRAYQWTPNWNRRSWEKCWHFLPGFRFWSRQLYSETRFACTWLSTYSQL